MMSIRRCFQGHCVQGVIFDATSAGRVIGCEGMRLAGLMRTSASEETGPAVGASCLKTKAVKFRVLLCMADLWFRGQEKKWSP